MKKLYRFTQVPCGLVFLALMISPYLTFSQSQQVESCTLINYQSSNGHAIYLANLPGAPSPEFSFDSLGGEMTIYNDGTAQITGIVQNPNQTNYKWELNIWLINQMNYADWTALGRGTKTEQAPSSVVNANKQDWTFYELDDTRSTLRGVPGTFYAGDTLNLSHRPSNLEFGIQCGIGANSKNGNEGMSGWFDYSGAYSGIGDINVDKSCDTLACDVNIDSVLTVCSSNNQFFDVQVFVSGSGTYDVSDSEGSPVQQGGAGVYNFGQYPDSVSVVFTATDIILDSCTVQSQAINPGCIPPNPCTQVVIDSVILTPICVSNDSFQVIVAVLDEGIAEGVNNDQGGIFQGSTPEGYPIYGNFANGTNVTFEIFNTDEPACMVFEMITADCLQDTCTVGIDSLYTICTSNDSFEVVVSFSGIGNNFSVFDNLGSPAINGVSPGNYTVGSYANNTDVFVTVLDSNFVDCNDTVGPVTADCTPPCNVGIDTIYTRCKTDSTFEIISIITGTPVTPGGFTIYTFEQGTSLIPLDTIMNVVPDTIAIGEYSFGTYIRFIVGDDDLRQQECLAEIDSLTFLPDSTFQGCDTTGRSAFSAGISNFTATMYSNQVTLIWQDLSIASGSMYEVQRSAGTAPFKKIGMLKAIEIDYKEQKYIFYDKDIEANIPYSYRIKERMKDGVKAYSKQIKLVQKMGNGMMFGNIYPNPSNHFAKIKLNAIQAHEVSCDIYDIQGQKVSATILSTIAGTQEIELPTQGLQAGIYFVRFGVENEDRYLRKFIIQD